MTNMVTPHNLTTAVFLQHDSHRMGRMAAFSVFFCDTCKHLVVSHLRSLAGRVVSVPNCLRAERKRASPPSKERWPFLRAADADLPWPSGPLGSSSSPPLGPSSWQSSATVGWCCHPAEEETRNRRQH